MISGFFITQYVYLENVGSPIIVEPKLITVYSSSSSRGLNDRFIEMHVAWVYQGDLYYAIRREGFA